MSPTLRGRRTRRRIDRLGIATDQDSRLDARAARRVLVRVLDETRRVGVDFRVCGTAAAQLQGVDLEADDVDLLFRDRDDLDSFAAALRRFPRPRGPLYLEDSRQATLVAHLSEHGCDHELLGRALEAAGVAPDVRLATLDAVGADR